MQLVGRSPTQSSSSAVKAVEPPNDTTDAEEIDSVVVDAASQVLMEEMATPDELNLVTGNDADGTVLGINELKIETDSHFPTIEMFVDPKDSKKQEERSLNQNLLNFELVRTSIVETICYTEMKTETNEENHVAEVEFQNSVYDYNSLLNTVRLLNSLEYSSMKLLPNTCTIGILMRNSLMLETRLIDAEIENKIHDPGGLMIGACFSEMDEFKFWHKDSSTSDNCSMVLTNLDEKLCIKTIHGLCLIQACELNVTGCLSHSLTVELKKMGIKDSTNIALLSNSPSVGALIGNPLKLDKRKINNGSEDLIYDPGGLIIVKCFLVKCKFYFLQLCDSYSVVLFKCLTKCCNWPIKLQDGTCMGYDNPVTEGHSCSSLLPHLEQQLFIKVVNENHSLEAIALTGFSYSVINCDFCAEPMIEGGYSLPTNSYLKRRRIFKSCLNCNQDMSRDKRNIEGTILDQRNNEVDYKCSHPKPNLENHGECGDKTQFQNVKKKKNESVMVGPTHIREFDKGRTCYALKKIVIAFIISLPSFDGYTTILVVVDDLTKGAHLVPLKLHRTLSRIATKFIKHVVKLHGFSKHAISYHDPIFISVFWRQIMKNGGINLHYNKVFHPQSDDQIIEELNRCLEQYLRAYACEQIQLWLHILLRTELWFNWPFPTTLEMKPYKAWYGFNPTTISNVLQGPTSINVMEELVTTRDDHRQQLPINLASLAALPDDPPQFTTYSVILTNQGKVNGGGQLQQQVLVQWNG